MAKFAPAVEKALRGFRNHRVNFHREVGGKNVEGDCPFSGVKGKFFVNYGTRCWDSKTAHISGTFNAFLTIVAKRNEDLFDKDMAKVLGKARELPSAAFKGWGIGYDGYKFTLPVYDINGKQLTDIRCYEPGDKTKSTAGASVGLLGVPALLDKSRSKEPVYICEGEWDAIAFNYLRQRYKQPGVVVAVPGAMTFKQDWISAFRNRDVVVLFDADAGGEQGELKVYDSLKGVVRTLKFLHWPPDVKDGFDVRDWVVFAIKNKIALSKCWKNLHRNLKPVPRVRPKDFDAGTRGTPKEAAIDVDPIKREELIKTYKKWLKIDDDDMLAIVFGSILANRGEGDPLWMFVVTPPGGMKSELLMTLEHAHECYAVSALTKHALVSGFNMGDDPSLLPQLNDKVLVIKDFTTILSMNSADKDEIFGQLRDAYDGRYEKKFGTNVHRKYESRFGVLAGVTPDIEKEQALHAGLGERFLRYQLERDISVEDEKARIRKAMLNSNKENKMRDELREAATRYLANDLKCPDNILNKRYGERMISLAMVCSRMRGVVSRDTRNPDLILSRATREFGTRMGKQLYKLAIGLCMWFGVKKIDEVVFKLVARVGLMSVPPKTLAVLQVLWRLDQFGGEDEERSMRAIASKIIGYNYSTINRVLQDLEILQLVTRRKITQNKSAWHLHDVMKELITEGKIFK